MVENEGMNSKKTIKYISPICIYEIFPFLDEKQKLKIIQYNKELIKKLKVDIKDYKKISGKYKIGKRNGKGKEYNLNDILIFEGEYLNGKKKGEGKEYYYNGKLKFEGEYLEGKIWNGKGYDKTIFIIYFEFIFFNETLLFE